MKPLEKILGVAEELQANMTNICTWQPCEYYSTTAKELI